MAVEGDLVTYLQGVGDLTCHIGSRIYPIRIPQNGGAYPCVTYRRVSEQRVRHHLGETGLTKPRFQFDVWAKTFTLARTIAQELRLALDTWSATEGATHFNAAFIDDEEDVYESPRDASDVGMYRVRQDYFIWHSEEVASP